MLAGLLQLCNWLLQPLIERSSWCRPKKTRLPRYVVMLMRHVTRATLVSGLLVGWLGPLTNIKFLAGCGSIKSTFTPRINQRKLRPNVGPLPRLNAKTKRLRTTLSPYHSNDCLHVVVGYRCGRIPVFTVWAIHALLLTSDGRVLKKCSGNVSFFCLEAVMMSHVRIPVEMIATSQSFVFSFPKAVTSFAVWHSSSLPLYAMTVVFYRAHQFVSRPFFS